MESISQLKTKLHGFLSNLLNDKIIEMEKAIASAKESRDRDTKSSAGDKHETSRAMMQEEMDKQQMQLQSTLKLRSDLDRIEIERSNVQVGFGSFVKSDKGCFYISVGLGQVEMDGRKYFVISSASPIGALMMEKNVGETVVFQQRKYLIQEIA